MVELTTLYWPFTQKGLYKTDSTSALYFVTTPLSLALENNTNPSLDNSCCHAQLQNVKFKKNILLFRPCFKPAAEILAYPEMHVCKSNQLLHQALLLLSTSQENHAPDEQK